MYCISVNNLCKEFKYHKKEIGLKNSIKNLFIKETYTKKAVKGISFSLEEGEIVGFLGPNGAGKTTTLKILSGIMYPTSGEVSILGYTPWHRKNDYKRQISIVLGQKNQLWWDLPANESLFLNKCIYKIHDDDYKKIVDELSSLLQVKELLNVQVRNLSLGERMKLELIAALIHKPKVIFLDEPTIGLDIIAQKTIRDFLKEYNKKEKTTVILTSHYLEDIEDLCNRAIVINHGNIVYNGLLKDINKKLCNKKILTFQFKNKITENDFKKFGEIIDITNFSLKIKVSKDNVQNVVTNIFSNFETKDFNSEDIPLEEGITALYNGVEVEI